MKETFRYYFSAIFSSMAFFIWVFFLIFCFIVPIFFRFDGIVESYLMRPLLRSQSVLYAIWSFIIIQCGYWCTSLATNRRKSGLSVWWSSSGITPLNQFGGLFMACLVPCISFTVIALGFLALISVFDRAIPLSLLLEQGLLITFASSVYCGLCILLGTCFEGSFALALGIATFVFSIKGMLIARSVVANLSNPLHLIFSWMIFLMPNFDLYFRPGAVIHFWPLLDFKTWVGITLYTVIWGLIFTLIARRLFRPWLI